ncbi:MAG: Fic family protein, partial [Mycoplasma sp.]
MKTTLYYADKLLLNKSHTEKDVIEKLSTRYPDYTKTNLSILNNDIYVCRSIIDSKINEYIALVDKITSLKQLNITDHNSKMIRDEIFYSLFIEHESSSRKDIAKILSNQELKDNHSPMRLEKNLWTSIQYVSIKPDINESNLSTIYRILTTNIEMFENTLPNNLIYRDDGVSISKYHGIDHLEIKKHMDYLFQFMNDNCDLTKSQHLFNVLLAHYYFEIIHPYFDFNGRTGRLLVYWYGVINNIKEYTNYFASSLGHYREQYISAFSESQKLLRVDATYPLAKML